MDIPQDEVGHCSPVSSEESPLKELMKWKQRRGGKCRAGWGGTGPYREGEAVEGAGSHYSVILLKMPLKDSPKRSQEKREQMECDNRKMPLMVVSLKRLDVERHLRWMASLESKEMLQFHLFTSPSIPHLLSSSRLIAHSSAFLSKI